ncbi:PH domain-containing protein [Peribacillus alkalitolerans]|uniref:PH domain-containing protein n=1 Tax=Peribacillus alkalitolerans TaxID=1550385 RepID=UPI0013D1CAB0|nr:PH domain-containing protein [Peribacillus alkalitolerans]
MFKKLASEALGLSDIGEIIKPSDYDKTEADDFVLSEDNEKIFFLIKSKKDEYCFTNLALIHVDGDSAVSSKRNLKRYDYVLHEISGVSIETAGTIDLDIELKFTIGNRELSIDVHKKHATAVADIYKALLAISMIQKDNARLLSYGDKSLQVAEEVIRNNRTVEANVSQEFGNIANFVNTWLTNIHTNHTTKDFSNVFQKYIQN